MLFFCKFLGAYAGVAQKADPANTGGYVSIEFFDGEKKDFDDHNYSRVLQLVGELTASGYQPGDITVLCRSNRNSSGIASYLNDNGVKVVSSDSLLLTQSPEVNFLINFLIFLTDREHMISRAAVVTYLFQGVSKHRG